MKGWVRSICSVVGKFTLTLCRLWNHWPPAGWIRRKEHTCRGSRTSARCRAHCGRWGLTRAERVDNDLRHQKSLLWRVQRNRLDCSPHPSSSVSLSHWLLLLLPEKNCCCLACRWTESKTIDWQCGVMSQRHAHGSAYAHTQRNQQGRDLLASRPHTAKHFFLMLLLWNIKLSKEKKMIFLFCFLK